MRRTPLWIVLAGSVVTVVGVLIQAFTIAAYVRTGLDQDWIDAHGGLSIIAHIGQLMIVIGAIWAWWGKWNMVGLAVVFLIVCVAQLGFLGDTDERGNWVNGLHGFLALVILLAATWYFGRSRRELGVGGPDTATT